ncbi:MAG TPA: hypothetical protein VFA12_20155 [Stellaceae bacterium]|nr:hypothetical protein [Stellaceae bacterium]
MATATATLTTSSLHNLPVGDIVDELGALKASIADLEAREKRLRDELVARGVGEAEGALFRATVSEAIRWTLDSSLVKERMGHDWWNQHCRTASVTTVKVCARTGSFKAAA